MYLFSGVLTIDLGFGLDTSAFLELLPTREMMLPDLIAECRGSLYLDFEFVARECASTTNFYSASIQQKS